MAVSSGEQGEAVDPREIAPEPEVASGEEYLEEYEELEQTPLRSGLVAPVLACLAAAGWTGFYAWAHQSAIIGGASPAEWSRLIVDWAVPVLLVIALWLLAMRTSRREAARFNDTAFALSQESVTLERRLAVINRELSLARDFIASQSRDLESLGRLAAERLSEHAGSLQGLIRDNGAQVEAIGHVSTTALDNMNRLRDELPVISNSSRDVANQIGHAGSVAKDRLEELITGFKRLNEFGEASSRQVMTLRGRIDEALQAFASQAAHLEEIAGNRFALLAENSAAFRAELDGREVEAFAAIRRRADALREELAQTQLEAEQQEAALLETLKQRIADFRDEGAKFAEELRAGETAASQAWSRAVSELQQRLGDGIRQVAEVDRRAMESAQQRLAALSEEARRLDETMIERVDAFDRQFMLRTDEANRRESELLSSLEQRLTAFDARIAERQQDHLAHVAGLTERSDALAERLAALSADMDAISEQGLATQDDLSQAAATLTARLAESQASISESRSSLASLTNDSVRLLELIRSSAEHSGTHLPQALSEAEQRLAAFERQSASLHDLIVTVEARGETLAAHVESARQNGTATIADLSSLEGRLAEIARYSDELAEKARGELTQAIATLERASSDAVTGLGEQHAETIRQMAERIGEDSSDAIIRTVQSAASAAIAELETAAEQAGSVGRETALQLRDQLSAVNELTANLERRVAHAREQAEEQIDHDFTRRMALITESLNSSAIDISKAFANDVTDTAWASYLRGDRGIFTRRAVRLLDNQQVRAIAAIYEEDGDFRETVNRYIHDFEAMLRNVLSTRDGNALAVTLLSSDVGKLYVALAQAIDRLRT